MKTNVVRLVLHIWLVLSEVPGWPDAPLKVRLRRVAPILIALVGVIALLVWKHGFREPQIASLRAQHLPVLVLEEEVASLGMISSDVQAEELSARAHEAAISLLDSPNEVTGHLRQLREQLKSVGWDAVFQAYDGAASDADAEAVEGVEFASARGRLVPIAGNAAPFASLLGVFDQISGGNKRIDLIRLGVRADEPGRLEVEINLRIACRAAHEKTS